MSEEAILSRIRTFVASLPAGERGLGITATHDPSCPTLHGDDICACTPRLVARDCETGRLTEIGLDGKGESFAARLQ